MPLVAVDVVQVSHQQQVFRPGKQVIDGRKLAGDADLRAHLVGLRAYVVTGDTGFAAAGRDECGQDLHGGGLTDAVGSEERKDCAFGDLEVDTVENNLFAERLAEPGRRDSERSRRPRVLVHAPIVKG